MALTTPDVCWNTPCTPQKHPPAITAVWMPSDGWASAAGAGTITASSAAREGAIAKAAIASAPTAAAQSERRLNWLRDMGASSGVAGFGSNLGGSHRSQSQAALPDAPRYAARPALLQRDAHEFVNKIPFVQGVSAERIASAEPSCVRVAQTGLGVHER